jgi:hypothetical protein
LLSANKISNSDRILALWQAINPQSWFPTELINGEPGPNTDLTPARDGSISFWSSDEVRKVERLGYTYPELLESTDPATIQNNINRRYAWSVQSLGQPLGLPMRPPPEMAPLDVSHAQAFGNQVPRPANPVLRPVIRAVAHPGLTPQVDLPLEPAHDQIVLDVGTVEQKPTDSQKLLGPDTDKLLQDKPKGSKLIRQWYFDSEAPR